MPRILFGWRPAWRRRLEKHIDKGQYRYAFAEPRDLDPAGWDCVIPFTFNDYAALAKWPDLQGKRFLVPDPDLVALCDDKLAFNRHILAGRFAHLIPPLADGADLTIPSILKKRRSEFGLDSVMVAGPPDPEIAVRLVSPDYFRQVPVSGDEEFALHLLAIDGAVTFDRTVRHRMPGPLMVKGAAARPLVSELLAASPHLASFAPLIAALRYTGTCCIDYKVAGDRPMLLELNPRVGITLLDDIDHYLDALLTALRGKPPRREPPWTQLRNRVVWAIDRVKQRRNRPPPDNFPSDLRSPRSGANARMPP